MVVGEQDPHQRSLPCGSLSSCSCLRCSGCRSPLGCLLPTAAPTRPRPWSRGRGGSRSRAGHLLHRHVPACPQGRSARRPPCRARNRRRCRPLRGGRRRRGPPSATITSVASAWRSTFTSASWPMRQSSCSIRYGKRRRGRRAASAWRCRCARRSARGSCSPPSRCLRPRSRWRGAGRSSRGARARCRGRRRGGRRSRRPSRREVSFMRSSSNATYASDCATRSWSSRAMRARSASAPRVRSRANQRALSIDSASRLERLSMRSRCSGPYTLGHDVFERDQPDERAPRPERGVEAAAGQRREPAFVGVDEPVVDQDRVRARERTLQRLRQIVVVQVRGQPHAFGELDRPHRLRARRGRARRAR